MYKSNKCHRPFRQLARELTIFKNGSRGARHSALFFFLLLLFFENYARHRRIVSASFRFAGDDRFATSAELLFPPSLPFSLSFSPGIEGFRIDFLLSLRGYCFTSAIRRDHKFHLTLNHPLGKLSSLMPRERLFPPPLLPAHRILWPLFLLPFFLLLDYVPQHATWSLNFLRNFCDNLCTILYFNLFNLEAVNVFFYWLLILSLSLSPSILKLLR